MYYMLYALDVTFNIKYIIISIIWLKKLSRSKSKRFYVFVLMLSISSIKVSTVSSRTSQLQMRPITILGNLLVNTQQGISLTAFFTMLQLKKRQIFPEINFWMLICLLLRNSRLHCDVSLNKIQSYLK